MRLRYFALLAAASVVLFQPALGQEVCETGAAHIVKVDVLASGQIQWDGVLLTREEVLYKLLGVGNMEHQTRIRMFPDKNAPQQSVARFLADAQKFGVGCLGFAGVEKQDQSKLGPD